MEGAPRPQSATLAVSTDSGLAILDKRRSILASQSAFRSVNSIQWSKDGRRIAFEGQRIGDSRGLFVANATDLTLIAFVPGAHAPSWSSDPNRLMYVSEDRVRLIDLRTLESDSVATGVWASWSPDGGTIILRDPQNRMMWRNSTSGFTNEVFKGRQLYWGPNWSDDEGFLLFVEVDRTLKGFFNWKCIEPKRLIARDWTTGEEALLEQICKSPTSLRFDWVKVLDWQF